MDFGFGWRKSFLWKDIDLVSVTLEDCWVILELLEVPDGLL